MRALIFGVGMLLGIASPANAGDGTTRQALDLYAKADVRDRSQIEIEASARYDGIQTAMALATYNGRSAPLYCIPDKLLMTSGQLMAMVDKEVKDKPSVGDYPFSFGVIATLIDTFPCSKGGTS